MPFIFNKNLNCLSASTLIEDNVYIDQMHVTNTGNLLLKNELVEDTSYTNTMILNSTGVFTVPEFIEMGTASISSPLLRIQSATKYVGNMVSMSVTAGNTLVAAFVFGNRQANIIFSDNKSNVWTRVASGSTTRDMMAVGVATNIAGGMTGITASAAGSTDNGLTVIEYSPCTYITSSYKWGNGNFSMSLDVTDGAGILLCFGNERNATYPPPTGLIAMPGSKSFSLIRQNTGHYDAQYDCLNGGDGFAAGTVTTYFTSSAAENMFINLALKKN